MSVNYMNYVCVLQIKSTVETVTCICLTFNSCMHENVSLINPFMPKSYQWAPHTVRHERVSTLGSETVLKKFKVT